MDRDSLRERIRDQFSYRGERADIWRAFDLVLDTDAFLNLGYSEWYQPHALASSQRRLVTEVGSRLASHRPTTDGGRLLDVGCGRGAPAIGLAEQYGFSVTGLDLVPYNVKQATENAREEGITTEFVVGDATQLPFQSASFAGCTAIDTLVYVPHRETVFTGFADVLKSEGVVVLSDLVMRSDISETDRIAVDAFADAWDMPPIGTVEGYKRALDSTALTLVETEDVTHHSVGQFRKWTTIFQWLVNSSIEGVLERLLRTYGLDPAVITAQVARAHHALPFLQHVILVAKKSRD